MSRGRLGGDLEALGLPDLVQTLTSGRKTARVVLRPGPRQAELWFVEGELVHAATSTRFGDLAVYDLLEWKDGAFVVEYGATSDARSVTQDATYLVLEGLRRIDERPPCPVPLPVEAGAAPAPRSTRLILGLTALAVIAGAIATAALLVGPDPTAANAAAPLPPPPAPSSLAPKPAAPPPRKTVRVRKPPSNRVVAAPEPLAPTAPESALAEEPVPLLSVAPAPVVVARVEPGPVPSSLVISGRSSGSGGTITVFVDGEAVLTRGPLEPGAAFGAVIDVPPGEHDVIARLRVENGVYEDSARADFASGESRTLRVTANRVIGAPVKVKLSRP